MARRTFIFDSPDRFVAGTIGEPGHRTFFLQARHDRRVVSVSLEKTQVAVLAERLGRLLAELDRLGIAEDGGGTGPADVAPLDEPLNEAFRATVLTLGWDGAAERILIEARAASDEDDDEEDEDADEDDLPDLEGETTLEALEAADDDPEGPDLLRVRLTADAARAFVRRAFEVVQAGRPACPLCGNPLEPTGHLCPRRNGKYVH
jgi:uncharacterized repeat protein (TIGR03847 family)